MIVIERVLARLARMAGEVVVQELGRGSVRAVSGRAMLELVDRARASLRSAGVRQGDRVALVGNNSARWIALVLAAHAEGAVAVPLHPRRGTAEIAVILDDCRPKVLYCDDPALLRGLGSERPEEQRLIDEALNKTSTALPPSATSGLAETRPVAIIYTSGTSGRPKGAVLLASAVDHIVRCAAERLDTLMEGHHEAERVLHYLPFCFAGSWILLLTCLSRSSVLSLNSDPSALLDDLRTVGPHYCLNVPIVLERIRSRVEKQMRERPRPIGWLYATASAAWDRSLETQSRPLDRAWLAIADALLFRRVRSVFGPDVRGLICGSAPLAAQTQRAFHMWGLPVYQVYGLTETTAICTIDIKGAVTPGRVGHAVPGVEMTIGANDEILVRGANLFAGYWEAPDATARARVDGWLKTGDIGDVDAAGNWRIHGRLDEIIVLPNGHKIVPARLEQAIRLHVPGVEEVVVVPDGTGRIAAVVVGQIDPSVVEHALDALNEGLASYEAVRSYRIHKDPLTIDNGFLTANGKVRRDRVAAWLRAEVAVST